MITRLIIISAGGLGREYYSMALGIKRRVGTVTWDPVGFLDDRPGILEGKDLEDTPIIGSPETFIPGENDRFICAIGNPRERDRYSSMIAGKGGEFGKLISPMARVASGRNIMPGVVISPFSLITCDTEVGCHTFINSHAVLGHDVKVGNFSYIGAGVHVGGNAVIGNYVTIHPNATILPGVEIGDSAVIGAGSVVIRGVKAGETVFGVPASVVRY